MGQNELSDRSIAVDHEHFEATADETPSATYSYDRLSSPNRVFIASAAKVSEGTDEAAEEGHASLDDQRDIHDRPIYAELESSEKWSSEPAAAPVLRTARHHPQAPRILAEDNQQEDGIDRDDGAVWLGSREDLSAQAYPDTGCSCCRTREPYNEEMASAPDDALPSACVCCKAAARDGTVPQCDRRYAAYRSHPVRGDI